jgi:hypothetical protein
MINFDEFRKFDRVKTLNPFEQQRQYWIYRNDVLNPIFRNSGGSGGSGGGKSLSRRIIAITEPANFSFFTLANQQFVTTSGDILVKTTTGYVKALYPYDIPVGPFGTGDPLSNISVIFSDTTFWNGALPFKIISCDINGNVSGDITYVRFDNLSVLKSLDFTKTKDTIEQIDVAGCADLEELIIPSSVSLDTLNVSNTQVQELNIQGCEFLQFLDISSTTFTPVYSLDLTGIDSLISITGDNSNLFGLITNSSFLEEVSLNDCNGLSLLTCDNFTGNGGLGRIQIKNCSIGPGGLDDLYNSLGTANGSNTTIYVYGNPGIGGSDPTIATSKGFTVDTNP